MTVAQNVSNAASARLATAISRASTERVAATETSAPKAAAATPRRATTAPTADAARGAKAGPEAVSASGASNATQGSQNVMSVAPGAATTTAAAGPYTPYDASMDTYAASASPAPNSTETYDLAPEPQQSVMPAGQGTTAPAPEAEQTSPVTGGGSVAADEVRGSGTTPITGTGAWSPEWQRRFEKLQLAPADIAYLANAGFDDDALFDIAMELDQVELLDPNAPQPNVDAGAAESANGPLPTDPAVDPAAGQQSAWSPQWEQKFTDVMKRMGMSASDIAAQLKDVESVPITAEQLQTAYEQMESALGDFDDAWEQKFTTLLDELKTPAKDKAQVLEQLASGGLTEAQLKQVYSDMENAKPAWNKDWESQFKALEVPEDMLKQLAESGAPKEALEQQLQSLIDIKMKFKNDGRLEKLQKANATPEEKWAVMTQDMSGKDFDKVVEQIHSSHVPAWKRVLSIGVNLIPGVYALQFVTGKDWVTGEKIDRTNPLNIVGAVASGFAGFTAVRGAIQGIQGLSAANAAFRAGTATAGLKNAATAANLLPKFEKGLRFTDYLKSAIPVVNRFGEAGRLSAVGRGYFQSMQLAAGTAAMTSAAGGGSMISKTAKDAVLTHLKAGASIETAVAKAGLTGKTATEAITNFNKFGYVQGGIGKFLGGSGNFSFNPFKNRATIQAIDGAENVLKLGSGVNFGTAGGIAQGLGYTRGLENVSKLAAGARTAGPAARAIGANPLLGGGRTATAATGLNMSDDVQRIATLRHTSHLANELGVSGGKFRSLFQLGASNKQAATIANYVERGGSQAYRVGQHIADTGRRYAGFVAPAVIGGATVGMMGKQVQPMWDYTKNWEENQAKQRELDAQREQNEAAADAEMQQLEQLYQQQQAGQAGQAAQAGTAPATSAPTEAAPAADAANQVYVDPNTGFYVDPVSGMQANPSTGDVYDMQGNLVGNVNAQQTVVQP